MGIFGSGYPLGFLCVHSFSWEGLAGDVSLLRPPGGRPAKEAHFAGLRPGKGKDVLHGWVLSGGAKRHPKAALSL